MADVSIFYKNFLIYGKIGHLTQVKSKMWTYKYWKYLDDEGIVTQSTLTYLKST